MDFASEKPGQDKEQVGIGQGVGVEAGHAKPSHRAGNGQKVPFPTKTPRLARHSSPRGRHMSPRMRSYKLRNPLRVLLVSYQTTINQFLLQLLLQLLQPLLPSRDTSKWQSICGPQALRQLLLVCPRPLRGPLSFVRDQPQQQIRRGMRQHTSS